MMEFIKICFLKNSCWTITVIFVSISGCAELDGIFPKFEPHKKIDNSDPSPNSEFVKQKQNMLTKENRVLHKKIEKLQSQIFELQKKQKTQSEDFILLRDQWEMNFVLLERSVEESLNSRKDTTKSEFPKKQVNKNINKKKEFFKKDSVLPIENFSLLETYQDKISEKSFENSQFEGESNINFQERKIEVIEEPGFLEPGRVDLNDLEETANLIEPDTDAVLTEIDSSESNNITLTEKDTDLFAFFDPDLNQSNDPLILIRHPGVKKIYNQGMTALIQKNHLQAIRIFENFTKRFPDNIDSDNAYYWIGRSYYELKEYVKSEEAFRKVLTLYEHRPTSQGYKTPDSIYMLGKLQIVKNNSQGAQYYWREVLKRYPGSAAARNAKREMKK